MEGRTSKRSLRLALVLGAAVAGTALVGWGGLAAWNAYTENAGNSVAAGTLLHNNYVSSNCASNLGTVPIASGTGWCSAAVTVAGADPANNALPYSATIKIDNTGTLASTFQVDMPAAAVSSGGTICADLTLAVSALGGGAVYPATALTTTMPQESLKNDAGTPVVTWNGGGTNDTGTGASGNTITVTVAAGASFAADYADAGQSCTFNLLFTQTAA